MPITQPQLEQYRSTAEQANQSATQFASQGSSVESELRDALNAKLAENKPLIEGRNAAQAAYLAAPANARANYADPNSANFVFNPYERGKLIANEQSLAYQPYANLTDYLGLSLGTINNLVNQGVGAYNTEAQNKLGFAQLAQNQFDTALGEYFKDQELKKGSGSGGSDVFNQLLLSQLLGGGDQNYSPDYGESPNYSPTQNGETVVNDQGYVWQFIDTQWVPIGTV